MSERQQLYTVCEAPVSPADESFTHEPYSGLPLADTRHVLTFTIPLPVAANNAYPTNFKTGRRFISRAALNFKHTAGIIVQTTANTNDWESGSGPLGLRLVLWFKDNRRTDIDGRVKLAQDAICEALGIDDSRIHELHVYRAGVSAEPRCEVTCWQL